MFARRRLRLLFAGLIVLTGCNALLDSKDIFLDPTADDGGPSAQPDASTDGSTTPEAAAGEGGAEASPCQADLQNDAKNCGRCGHDCVGGLCTAGKCDAVVLAAGLGNPVGIALGPSDVYVTTYRTETVVSVPKAGGTLVPLAAGEVRARGAAVMGTKLYWGNGDFAFDDAGYKGGVWQCTLPACSDKQILGVGDFGGNPTINNGNVYYAAINAGEIRRVPLAGGPSIAIASTTRPFALAVDDVHVYFTSNQPQLYRGLLDGGTFNTEEAVGATGDDSKGYVAVDGQRVYWTYTEASGVAHVVSVAKATPLGATVEYGGAQDNVRPVGIAVDDTYVYWTTDGASGATPDVPMGDGKVLACPKQGCGATGPILLATGNLFAGPVVHDATAVYWVEYGTDFQSNGRIRKVAKP